MVVDSGTSIIVMTKFYYYSHLETLKKKTYATFAIIKIYGKMETTGKDVSGVSLFLHK